MAILNFPPTAGEPIDGSFTYSSDGVTYSWDGYKWTADTGSGGGGDANHSDGPTPPTTGELADQWFNTDDGRLYTYTADESGALVWIDASPDSIAGGSGGGGSGDGTTVNYNGASAWGVIASDGTLENGFNCTTSKTNNGTYLVTFSTPMPSDTYSVVATDGSAVPATITTGGNTTNSFTLIRYNSNTAEDGNINFAVHSANAIAPQSGVGADAWGDVKGSSGNLNGGYNCTASKNSTGNYRVTFLTSMPNTSYGIVFGMGKIQKSINFQNKTTAGFDVETKDISTNVAEDRDFAFTVHASSTVTPTYTWTRDGTTLKPANDGDGVQVGASYDNVFLTSGKGDGTSPSQLVINGRPASGSNNAFRIDSFPSNGTTQTTVAKVNYDGSSTFAGNMQIGTIDQSSTTATGVDLNKVGVLKAQRNAAADSNSNIIAAYKGSSLVWYVNGNGASSFTSNVTVPNVIFNLEPDNSVNYTATMVDGEETQVYNGPTLDVKELLLTLQTAATRIATLEAKVATLESDHTTLMNNNNNGGGY